jgi:transposase InsO family protein
VIELIGEANAAGAGLVRACGVIGICLRTLKRWRKDFLGDGDGKDRRKGSAWQCHRRGRARLPQEPRSVPRLRADRPNALWSWDITFLPTTVRGVWLYLYLVVDVWSRKVVAWDVAEVESAQIAADLVQRACLKERYHRPNGFGSRKCQQQPLILHADNGNAMRGATLESRLEEMGVLRSFSRPRVSNDNPYSESLFRTVKYRPDYPTRPFASKGEACEWVAAFVDWYNPRLHHSAIKFVTPHQRHSGAAAVPIRKEVRSGCCSEHLSKPIPGGASRAASSADGSHRVLIRSGGLSGRPPGGG